MSQDFQAVTSRQGRSDNNLMGTASHRTPAADGQQSQHPSCRSSQQPTESTRPSKERCEVVHPISLPVLAAFSKPRSSAISYATRSESTLKGLMNISSKSKSRVGLEQKAQKWRKEEAERKAQEEKLGVEAEMAMRRADERQKHFYTHNHVDVVKLSGSSARSIYIPWDRHLGKALEGKAAEELLEKEEAFLQDSRFRGHLPTGDKSLEGSHKM